ncbi:MAG TPA: HAMP domain-containing sensor histidine kinase [Acidimicrobiia bacterium]|nr:HAMP domain-containing sensor histidine kinase [Acidimicrobiia bacterium]
MSGAARASRFGARRGSVRFRTTALATVVLGVALLVGALALVGTMRSTLTREVRSAARVRAAEVVAALEAGDRAAALRVIDVEEQLVQVLDEHGVVVDASENLAGEGPVASLAPGESARIRAPIDDDDFLAVAEGAETDDGARTVIVARTVEAVDESTDTVVRLLTYGLPLLLALAAFTTWKVVGRALAPVEEIRREVDEISGRELHRRVPEPGGGDEIARLAATMNAMLDRLEQSQSQQRQFVSDASHELRSPIAIIRQHAEVALAHPDRIAGADLAATVLSENGRVERLVDDLLTLARADEGLLVETRRPVDLDDLVFAEVERVRATTSVRVDTRRVSAGRIAGEPAGLRRVVRNLLDNATRHARTRVEVGLTTLDGEVVLDVADDGPGIPLVDRARIFERFVRLDDARARDAGGSGLGLAIVAEVVAAHGGSVAVSDGPDGGARFVVRLPEGANGGG